MCIFRNSLRNSAFQQAYLKNSLRCFHLLLFNNSLYDFTLSNQDHYYTYNGIPIAHFVFFNF